MTNYFVVGDVHGSFEKLEKLLKNYNPDNQKLVFLGDLIDKGNNALEVLSLVMKLIGNYGGVAIRGNHEEHFISAISEPQTEMLPYCNSSGSSTINSLLGASTTSKFLPWKISEMIIENHFEIVEFIRNTEYFLDDDNHIFVHAGVNLSLNNWRDTSITDFTNIRNPFIFGTNRTGKKIVFGHTETSFINKDKNHDIWISPCQTKIGIDGGAVSGGLLHGIVLNTGQIIKKFCA